MGLGQCDHINRMITLSVITLSGFKLYLILLFRVVVHFAAPVSGPHKLAVDDSRVIHQELSAGAEGICGLGDPLKSDPRKC